jgi:hypothetical protein
MSKDRVLLYTDSGKAADLQMKANDVREQCNALLELYQVFSGDLIKDIEDWRGLVADPVGYFDAYVVRTVKLNIAGNRQINAEQLALLTGYDRVNYRAAVTGMPVDTEGCEPCKKLVKRRTKAAISGSTYNMYADMLTFVFGKFVVNQSAIDKFSERFKYYAEGPAQLKRLKHWNELKDTLQAHIDAGHIGPAGAQIIADFCKLRFVNLKFYLDDLTVRNDVLRQTETIKQTA